MSERIWAMVKLVKLIVNFSGENMTSPVMARAFVLAARHGPSSWAEAERARTAARTASSNERKRID